MPNPLNWNEIELWAEQACADARGATEPPTINGRRIVAANKTCTWTLAIFATWLPLAGLIWRISQKLGFILIAKLSRVRRTQSIDPEDSNGNFLRSVRPPPRQPQQAESKLAGAEF
jgi:hypothetical protein